MWQGSQFKIESQKWLVKTIFEKHYFYEIVFKKKVHLIISLLTINLNKYVKNFFLACSKLKHYVMFKHFII